MSVFSRKMNPLDHRDMPGAFRVLADFIGYLQERVEFSFQGRDRKVAALEERVKKLEDLSGGKEG